jgi:hypothetical protein
MRSPSGIAVFSVRGRAPTETTMVSASTASKSVPLLPAPVETTTRLVPSSRPSLLPSQPQQPLVDGGEVDGHLGSNRPTALAAHEELHPEVGGFADVLRRLRRCDQGLRRNDVRENRGSADTGALDERHFGAQLGSGEGRFVTARPSAHDRDALLPLELIGHERNCPLSRQPPPKVVHFGLECRKLGGKAKESSGCQRAGLRRPA